MADTFESQKEAFLYEQTELSTTLTKSSTIPVEQSYRIKMHATTNYGITRSSTTTSQPVSSGADVSDHYTNNITSVRLTGVVADHVNPFRLDRNEKTSTEYVEAIQAMMDKKKIVTVILPELGFLQNCMITSFSPNRRTATGLGTEISITLQRILVATIGDTRQVRVEEKDLQSGKDPKNTLDASEGENTVVQNAQDLKNDQKIAEADLAIAKRIEEAKLPAGGQ